MEFLRFKDQELAQLRAENVKLRLIEVMAADLLRAMDWQRPVPKCCILVNNARRELARVIRDYESGAAVDAMPQLAPSLPVPEVHSETCGECGGGARLIRNANPTASTDRA